MISYEEALAILRESARRAPARSVRVPVSASLKTSVSEDVLGREDVPFFDNSAMDGFAVCAEATRGASSDRPVTLKICATLSAGEEPVPPGTGNSGSAVEIMTGAVMPGAPFDAVVRIEDVEIRNQGTDRVIVLRKGVTKGENVRLRGSDFQAGQVVARAGEWITSAHIMAFAGLGIESVAAQARPKVAVLNTGKELLGAGGRRTSPAQIWNSSGPFLVSRLGELGCEVLDQGLVPDDPGIFCRKITEALEWGADVILSTGAVSMGKHDFVVNAFRDSGGELLFHKVAIRPGKPVCFGEFPRSPRRAVFFGLPGNPISTAVGMRFFVEPYLRCLLKMKPEAGIRARLSASVKKPEGFRCFYKARVQIGPGGATASILPAQGSYVVSSFVEAGCWAVLAEKGSFLDAGAEVEILPKNDMEGVSCG